MKTYLQQLIWIPILLLLFSCAETDDVMVDIDETDPLLRIDAIVAQLDSNEIEFPKYWEQTRDPIKRAAYARHLISIGRIPLSLDLNQRYSGDPIVDAEYYRAQLINRFGDIPQVHTYANSILRSALGIYETDAEVEASKKAYEFLFPTRSGDNKIPVHEYILEEEKEWAKIRKEDPQKWIDHIRAQLFKDYGETPDVRIIANFMEKIELGVPITEAEYDDFIAKIQIVQSGKFTMEQTYVQLEAKSQLGMSLAGFEQCYLNLFRTAKAEAIPFVQIQWDIINMEHEFCQTHN